MSWRRRGRAVLAVGLAALLAASLSAMASAGQGDANLGAEEKRHPLLHEWHREGYNLWTEMKAGVEQEAYGDVAELIHNSPVEVERGLLIDFGEPDLLVSYRTMIALLARDYAPVREAMRGRFGEVSGMRLSAATRAGDRAAVEAVTVQLCGTDAAVAAHRWLGDRSLSAGDFASALRRYQQALGYAPSVQRADLAARVRLAGAMMGRRVGTPVETPVQCGGSQFTAEQFEKLIAELLVHSAAWGTEGQSGGLGSAEVPPAPPPGRYQVRRWPKFSFQATGSPLRARPQEGIDWTAPALSAAIAGGLLVVSDGGYVGALELWSGKTGWFQDFDDRAAQLSGRKGPPLRPLVTDEAVYVRHGSRTGLRLYRLAPATGTIVWASEPGHCVVSDPLSGPDRVLALTMTSDEIPGKRYRPWRTEGTTHRTRPQDTGRWQLRWTAFGSATGEILDDRPLVWVEGGVKSVPECRAAVAEGTILAAVPGAVVCSDLDGNVQWVRRQPWGDDPSDRRLHVPLAAGDRVLAVQSGPGRIQCLDLSTGRRCWESNAPGITRPLGIVGDRLIVEEEAGLAAIGTGDGQVAWRHPVDDTLQVVVYGGPGGLMYASCEPTGTRTWTPTLVWLDAASGKPAAQCRLDDLAQKGYTSARLSLGPLVIADRRVFAGYRPQDASRKRTELIELLPAEGLLPAGAGP